MQPELLAIVSQFGPAGLLGALWLVERRQASKRERQLTEAHKALTSREHDLAAMLAVVRDNTRAIARLEQTQRQLLDIAHRVLDRLVDARNVAGRSPADARCDRANAAPAA